MNHLPPPPSAPSVAVPPANPAAGTNFSFLTPGRSATPDAAPQEDEFTYLTVKEAVDEVYELRTRMLRIALVGVMLQRPDPNRPSTTTERAENLFILRTDIEQFRALLAMLENGSPFARVVPKVASWITTLAREKQPELESARRVLAASEQVLHAASEGSDAQTTALRNHRHAARAGFHEAMISLCSHLWADYHRVRNAELDRALNAAKTLSNRLNRLERIGTHVRLVSLNASVEASRIGDEGRGLTLIAREFKDLAEEVAALACEAREDVNAMHVKD